MFILKNYVFDNLNYLFYFLFFFSLDINHSISPRVRAWHMADFESGDSAALETTVKHCLDAKARFTPKMAFGPRFRHFFFF